MEMCSQGKGDGGWGCRQRQDYCQQTGQVGSPFSVWLIEPSGNSTFVRYVCIGDPEDILTVEDVGEEIKKQWVAYVPEQKPTMQPPNGKALVNLPAIFHSGQPKEMPETSADVFNFTVNVKARGEWAWEFAPGVTRTFDVPGSTYPDDEVSHTYAQSGPQNVVLNTRWWGSFTVGNEGPWDIETPATQGPYELPLEVVESSPVLGR